MSKVSLASGIRHVNQRKMLLVFPQDNQLDPASLWYEFHPRTKMRWEWDEHGDTRVGDLWHLRERLSSSGRVIYTKWFRGRATVIAKDLFVCLLRAANPEWPNIVGLSVAAREILDLLEEDSPLSTKQLKRASGLVGREAESSYHRALKELWERLLIVGFGEVDEGAFPSLAVGATKVLFEDEWNQAGRLEWSEALSTAESLLLPHPAFSRFLSTLKKKWSTRIEASATDSF